MSKYITSVQLKNAGQDDYERLDLEMAKYDFVKISKSGHSGSSLEENLHGYREYDFRGLTLQEVVKAAYTAASSIGKQYSLTVMKAKRTVAV